MKRIFLIVLCSVVCFGQIYSMDEVKDTPAKKEAEIDPILRLREAYAKQGNPKPGTRIQQQNGKDGSGKSSESSESMQLAKEFVRNSIFFYCTYYFWAKVHEQAIDQKKLIIKSALSGVGISILPIVLDTALNIIF